MNEPGMRACGMAAVATLLAGFVSAAEASGEPRLEAALEIGRALHTAVQAENLRAGLVWSDSEPQLRLSADALTLPEPVGRVEGLRVVCPAVALSSRRIGCADARVEARLRGISVELAPLTFGWERETGKVDFSASWPGLFGAEGHFTGTAGSTGVRVDFDLAQLDLRSAFASSWGPGEGFPVTFGAGRVDVSGHMDTRGTDPELVLDFAGSGIEFSDPEGLRAGEAVVFAGRVGSSANGWAIQLGFSEGAVFIDPWFLDFGEVGPVALRVAGLHAPDSEDSRWRIGELRMELGEAGYLEGTGLAGVATSLDEGDVQLAGSQMDIVGEWLLSPFLAGTALGAAAFDGAFDGALRFGQGRLREVTLGAADLDVVDAAGRFALQGLTGRIEWSEDAPAAPSTILARDGHVFGMPLGPFTADFRLHPRGFQLLEPLEVPLLDGALRADTLRIAAGPDGPRVDFEGGIRALSLEQMSNALDWPPFAGTVSGVIPRVRYDRGALAVEGRLLVRVFDGDLVLRDLEIRDLFGPIPVLEMAAEIHRIDLDLLTRAFDVGRIEGRLSGTLEDLVLVDWTPRRMNLLLATPEEDPGRRRISQRAVDNLTEIGGGLQAALSAPFLRFFEDFPYRRLGIGCALEGDRCRMSGVADRDDGSFVLVEGRGIPHLQVIGYTREVDWPVLIQRLQAVRAEQDPAVE
jgi:hypothetical protein